jgi:hypothetical protein
VAGTEFLRDEMTTYGEDMTWLVKGLSYFLWEPQSPKIQAKKKKIITNLATHSGTPLSEEARLYQDSVSYVLYLN